MNESNRERARATVVDLAGIAILGLLMATVVEALSPEYLMRSDPGVMASVARPATTAGASLSRAA
jgi:hypothetical protein